MVEDHVDGLLRYLWNIHGDGLGLDSGGLDLRHNCCGGLVFGLGFDLRHLRYLWCLLYLWWLL